MPETLLALPEQPADVPFPTESWPRRDDGLPPTAADLVDQLFADTDAYGQTYGLVLVHRGAIVAERYAGELVHFDRPSEPVEATTKLHSWSMAKSILHAVVGILVRDGRLDLDAPAAVPRWHQDPDDPRGEITLQQMLEMRDGLDFMESYTVDGASDVVTMLFGDGQADMAGYAASKPLAHPPGTFWNYSSGTSNIISRIAGDVIGGGEAGMRAFLDDELFGPLGMRSVDPRFDESGTFVASSSVYAPVTDFARFGLLYLRDGVWDGKRLLPEGWVDHARQPVSWDADEERWYGRHWWAWADDLGTFWANGYEGQCVKLVPALDLMIVRLGKTPEEHKQDFAAWRAAVRDAFRPS
jgi:CubicO group peptidase (beta-lactamase class C family)